MYFLVYIKVNNYKAKIQLKSIDYLKNNNEDYYNLL